MRQRLWAVGDCQMVGMGRWPVVINSLDSCHHYFYVTSSVFVAYQCNSSWLTLWYRGETLLDSYIHIHNYNLVIYFAQHKISYTDIMTQFTHSHKTTAPSWTIVFMPTTRTLTTFIYRKLLLLTPWILTRGITHWYNRLCIHYLPTINSIGKCQDCIKTHSTT